MALIITDIRRKYYQVEGNEETSSSSTSEGEVMKPYNVKLSGGLHIGQQVFVKGCVNSEADRFHINLQTSKSEDANVLLHFNPRQSQNCVVRNTRVDGGWQEEEREGPDFPFSEGADFEVRILVRDYGYEVFVNGKFFCSYNHRGSFEDVKAVSVHGDAQFYEIGAFDKLNMPYTGWIPKKMKEGRAVRIRGVVKPDPYRFDINLLCSSGDNSFHFNPRWDQNEIVRNANLGGWGGEEREAPFFPFQAEEMFDVLITAVEGKYRVYVNGEYFLDFDYRCDVNDVDRIAINGDVELIQVEFMKHQAKHHYWEIPHSISPGDCVVVKGVVKEGADRFHINLQQDRHGDSPIALHFNPRQGQDTIVHNHFQDGNWGEEERCDFDSALGHNKPFLLVIMATDEDYRVFLNGKKLSVFSHRMPMEDVRFVAIDGDADFYTVQVVKNKGPQGSQLIPGEMVDDRWITVCGVVNNDADRFHINLQCGEPSEADIALHFNPRMSQDCVVRNSLENGGWQEEERDAPCMPFPQGEIFEVVFGVKEDKFKVYVNGHRFIEYSHRMPRERITHVTCEGDAAFLPVMFQ
ncbi:galectin-4 isoform X1 [Lingula anatina]|uniref:Galectin-4 isoform X1 n=2 Tax=Lingula anatina TaxID=7574 RepID=A0A2R2MTP6_LINAN|nr:galectin-4 isoform X1 [Lingula anatina]|eukprot:XP_023933621.1 galectin-4 isoform X1 [Lingula anatina]